VRGAASVRGGAGRISVLPRRRLKSTTAGKSTAKSFTVKR
jgi:hypothetical protein